jgi:lipoate synthase
MQAVGLANILPEKPAEGEKMEQLTAINDTIKAIFQYLGPEARVANGISGTLPTDETAAMQVLIKLYEVLKTNIETMERELKASRSTLSFESQIAIAKEIQQRETMCGEIDALISKLQDK